jgi:hypothetical protein
VCKWWKSWFPTAGMLEAQNHPESVFVNILRSPGIDSYLGRASRTALFVVPVRQAT